MTINFYPAGNHPEWCELGSDCDGPIDPHHIGRTSLLYGQSGEARIKVQLVRMDESVPIGTRANDTQIALTLTNLVARTVGGKACEADAYLSPDEAQAIAHVLT